ncbi:MAG: iron ABC transporter permease [Gammaproteobacteria bacterium]|nr:iron ABC transporter permease [Gammaproteobacteria bacterium]MAY02576.1 iron ABC transporter permease [Gammaproteobacteria bacterium]|tara:strand:+ start:965 stop:2638 length:1674 start_codon:yes stop_codon:yes gene_type:complete
MNPSTVLASSTVGRSFGSLPWKIISYLIAAIVIIPILVIFTQWGTVGYGEQAIWQHLFNTKLDRLLLNTVVLLFGVGFGVTLLGVSLAWLCSVCDFPGRRVFEWALMLPLAIPAYVMAFVFLGMMNYAGPVQTALRGWFGQDVYFPNVQGSGAVIVVLSLVLYPYVYMLARSAFVAQGRQILDAGRILGKSYWQAFFRLAIPVARPAIVAGIALALMETLADFGAVSIFNYDTFTTAIYDAWYGLFNLAVAAQLASLLLLFVALMLVLEQKGRAQARYIQKSSRNLRPYQLRGGRALAASAYCTGIFLIAFALPFAQLVLWAMEIVAEEFNPRYWSFLFNTLGLGVIAALATTVFALMLAYVKRLPGAARERRWQGLAIRVSTLGYALPGSVLAVGIILSFTLLDQALVSAAREMFSLSIRPFLVGSLFALVLAYSTRFMAVAFAPVESGFERINPTVIEAAKSLGSSPGRVLRQVYVPLLRPGILTALIIVFVDVMKEMPATLIMRPFGWDTLAVRIYQMTAEGQWERAALPSVTLILLGLIPVILLIRSGRPAQI